MTKNFLVVLLGVFLLVMPIVAQSSVEADYVATINDLEPYREYPLRVARTGSTVSIDMRPLEGDAGGDLDTLLYLVDSAGTIVATNDDRRINEDSSSLLVFPQAESGQYRIIATRYNVEDGTTKGEFALNIDVRETADEATYQVRPGDLLNAGFPIDYPTAEQGSWTILAYYGGDNNLEEAILDDLREFEIAGGSDAIVHIVALVDRSPGFYDGVDDWTGARVFDVGAARDARLDGVAGDALALDSKPIAEMPNFDSSNGENLARFLTWGIQKFPADNYIVAFASHGAGWNGVIQDDSEQLAIETASTGNRSGYDESAIISLSELTRAFEIATTTAGVEKFALLINDACLMSSIEYYSRVAPYFDYSIASPEIVVDPALDMTLLTNLINEEAAAPDFEDIMRQLVDKYIDVDILKRDAPDVAYLTSAGTNLNKFSEVEQAVETFAATVNANASVRSLTLGAARSNAYTYTHFLGSTDKVDLGNLMRQVIATTRDSELISAAEAVLTALDTVRVYGRAGERVTDITTYYNIYFPEENKEFSQLYFDQTPLKEWSRMLRNYYNSFTPQRWAGTGGIPFHEPSAPKVNIVSQISGAVSIVNPPTIQIEYIGRNLSNGSITVDRILADTDSRVRLVSEPIWRYQVDESGKTIKFNQWDEGVEKTDVTWDVGLPVLTDGTTSANEFINYTDDVTYLDGRYRTPGSETWNDVTVAFDLQGTFQRVLSRSVTNAQAVVDIPIGSEFQAYQSVVSSDGRVFNEPGNLYIWQDYGLRWQRDPAPAGEYNIGLLLTSYGGSTGFASAAVSVNNENIDANLRGFTDNFLGYTVPYYADWNTWASLTDLSYRSNSLTGDANFTVYLAPRLETDDLTAVAEAVAATNALTLTGDPTEATVSGFPVLVFDYTRSSTLGEFSGRLFTYYYAPFQLGYAFAADVLTTDTSETLDTLYNELAARTRLFDILEYEGSLINHWQASLITDDTTYKACYQAPIDWTETVSKDGWTRYTLDQDQTAFFATQLIPINSEIEGITDGGTSIFTTGRVTDGLTDIVLSSNQPYFAPRNLDWQVTLYTARRNDVGVSGRVYTTQSDSKIYALWMETAQTESSRDTYVNIFEPFVNSYTIISPDEFC